MAGARMPEGSSFKSMPFGGRPDVAESSVLRAHGCTFDDFDSCAKFEIGPIAIVSVRSYKHVAIL